jgi:hypothetical protein
VQKYFGHADPIRDCNSKEHKRTSAICAMNEEKIMNRDVWWRLLALFAGFPTVAAGTHARPAGTVVAANRFVRSTILSRPDSTNDVAWPAHIAGKFSRN